MANAYVPADFAPPSDVVILFALDLEREDPRREQILELCQRHGEQPKVVDAAVDPLFAEHVKDSATRAHFPLLCVHGLLVGGIDVVLALESAGKLGELFDPRLHGELPQIALSQPARAQLKAALTEEDSFVRIVVSAAFEHDLAIDTANPDDIQLMLGDIPCVIDPESAERAHGLAIDWVSTNGTSGFRIDNPNRPEPVRYVNREWVDAQLDHRSIVIDTRTQAEYERGHLPGAVALNAEMIDALERLDKQIPLLFYCGNGVRSRRAAERYHELGHRTVYCLENGISENAELIVPTTRET